MLMTQSLPLLAILFVGLSPVLGDDSSQSTESILIRPSLVNSVPTMTRVLPSGNVVTYTQQASLTPLVSNNSTSISYETTTSSLGGGYSTLTTQRPSFVVQTSNLNGYVSRNVPANSNIAAGSEHYTSSFPTSTQAFPNTSYCSIELAALSLLSAANYQLSLSLYGSSEVAFLRTGEDSTTSTTTSTTLITSTQHFKPSQISVSAFKRQAATITQHASLPPLTVDPSNPTTVRSTIQASLPSATFQPSNPSTLTSTINPSLLSTNVNTTLPIASGPLVFDTSTPTLTIHTNGSIILTTYTPTSVVLVTSSVPVLVLASTTTTTSSILPQTQPSSTAMMTSSITNTQSSSTSTMSSAGVKRATNPVIFMLGLVARVRGIMPTAPVAVIPIVGDGSKSFKSWNPATAMPVTASDAGVSTMPMSMPTATITLSSAPHPGPTSAVSSNGVRRLRNPFTFGTAQGAVSENGVGWKRGWFSDLVAAHETVLETSSSTMLSSPIAAITQPGTPTTSNAHEYTSGPFLTFSNISNNSHPTTGPTISFTKTITCPECQPCSILSSMSILLTTLKPNPDQITISHSIAPSHPISTSRFSGLAVDTNNPQTLWTGFFTASSESNFTYTPHILPPSTNPSTPSTSMGSSLSTSTSVLMVSGSVVKSTSLIMTTTTTHPNASVLSGPTGTIGSTGTATSTSATSAGNRMAMARVDSILVSICVLGICMGVGPRFLYSVF